MTSFDEWYEKNAESLTALNYDSALRRAWEAGKKSGNVFQAIADVLPVNEEADKRIAKYRAKLRKERLKSANDHLNRLNKDCNH